jgi:hypothetical protein
MANIRISNLATTVTTVASDDYVGVDGATNGTRKKLANSLVTLTDTQTLTNKTLTSPALASPTMTGTPTAPTAAEGTDTTQVATCAFVLANGGGGSGSGDVTAASNLGLDNCIVRADGILKGVQGSTVTVGDTGGLTIPGVVVAGSGPTTVTDGAGKILSAALNTVSPANGGTGVVNNALATLTRSGNHGLTLTTTGTTALTLPTSGTVATVSGDEVTAGSNFGTDNVLIRSNGTSKAVQSTCISVDDSNNLTGVNDVTVDGDFDISGATITGGTGTGSVVRAISSTTSRAIPSTDDSYNGEALTGFNAGATIAQWEAVILDGTGTWQLADANGAGLFPARGLAVAAYVSTNAATILRQGLVRNDAWNWTIGGSIYLSTTAGGLTQTAPSTSGDCKQEVGFAVTADIACFNFSGTPVIIP